MDYVKNASSLNRRASSSSILDASAERPGPLYIFITGVDGVEGVDDRGAVDTVERRRVRRNKEPDILPRKLTIEVDVESGDDGLKGGKVDPLVFSLLRKVARRVVVAGPSAVERVSTVGKAVSGGL